MGCLFVEWNSCDANAERMTEFESGCAVNLLMDSKSLPICRVDYEFEAIIYLNV